MSTALNILTGITNLFSWENIKHIFTYNEGEPMIFTQFFFWGFFAIVLFFYSFINKKRGLRNAYLFLVSLFFYYKTSGLFISILLFSTVSDFIIGQLIYRANKKNIKQLFVAASVIINLFVLGYFKYAYFFTESFNEFFHTNYEMFNHFAQWTNDTIGSHFEVNKILLPVGISFYTFQTISYSVDVYRGHVKPVRNILDFG
ncbi:MAG: MBOAT family protein, partial [Flavobacteriaceae bacterium]